jgi:RimJ/RimL family protein N-acetyltransferase
LQWVLDGGHGPYVADELLLDRAPDGSVHGMIYFGTQLVVAADDEPPLDAFALETRKHPYLRSFVGPRPIVHALWARVKHWHRPPVLVRERQPLYVLRAPALPAGPPVAVRRARVEEAALVAEHSARMVIGELGYDPSLQRASFTAGIRRAIEHGLWWVWIENGELRFQCNVGARTPAPAQVQGVWSPAELRGRGYAAAALGAIAGALLTEVPSISLYVNDFNHAAIRLYEGLGFERAGELATYLFP